MESVVGMKVVDSVGMVVVVGSAVKSTAEVLTTGNLIDGGVVKWVIVVKTGRVVVVSGRIEAGFGVAGEDGTVEGDKI